MGAIPAQANQEPTGDGLQNQEQAIVEIEPSRFYTSEIPALGEDIYIPDNAVVSIIPTKTFTDTPSSLDQPGSGILYKTQ